MHNNYLSQKQGHIDRGSETSASEHSPFNSQRYARNHILQRCIRFPKYGMWSIEIRDHFDHQARH